MFVSKAVMLFCIVFGQFFASTVSAEIYRWVDESGSVHFGDCRPAECQTEEITIPHSPSEQRRQEAQDRTERLKEFLSDNEARRERPSDQDESANADNTVPRSLTDISCFARLQRAWGGRISDSREDVSQRSLTSLERARLKKLFNALKRRRSGSVKATSCIGPNASPPTRTDEYRVDLDARWESKRTFRLDAHLTATSGAPNLRRFYWFLPSPDGLRYQKRNSSSWFELDQARNDVGILKVSSNELTFFLRRGGRLRKTEVLSLRKNGHRFRFSEYFYVQGRLTGKRHWLIAG